MEGLPKKIWDRLSDRSKLPRCLWFPPKRHLALGPEEWRRQHDEVSISLRRTMITLLGYSFFCMLTLAAPDISLITRDAKIKVPFAGTEVSYQAFLIIGPLTMFGLVVYLHILLGHWVSLGKHKDIFGLPYIFNIDSRMANGLANFIFYWLPCLVFTYFTWKALPRPAEAFLLVIQTVIFSSCMVVLRIRRFPDDQHHLKFLALYLLGWLLGIGLLLSTQFGLFQRSLNLYRADLSKQDLKSVNLFKANLAETNLKVANLRSANLQEATLVNANLQKANLEGANLQRADLRGALLQKADLRGALLQEADLRGALLQEADLEDANLQEATLVDANLQDATLVNANLQNAKLEDANLQNAKLGVAENYQAAIGANLTNASLSNANLKGTILVGVNLQDADLNSAKLNNADLGGAKLQRANLNNAELQEANLRWANLSDCKNLTQEQLNSACGNDQTKLPPGLTIKKCEKK